MRRRTPLSEYVRAVAMQVGDDWKKRNGHVIASEAFLLFLMMRWSGNG